MLEINLLAWRPHVRQKQKKIMYKSLLLTLGLSIGLSFVCHSLLNRQYAEEEEAIALLKQQATKEEDFHLLEFNQTHARESIHLIKQEQEEVKKCLQLLMSFSAKFHFKKIIKTAETLQMTGFSASIEDLMGFTERLNTLPFVHHVHIAHMGRPSSHAGLYFQLEAKSAHDVI